MHAGTRQEEDVYEWVVIKSQGMLSSACACVCMLHINLAA